MVNTVPTVTNNLVARHKKDSRERFPESKDPPPLPLEFVQTIEGMENRRVCCFYFVECHNPKPHYLIKPL